MIAFNRVDRALVRRGEMAAPAALAQALDMPLMGILPESRSVYRALLRRKRVMECGDEQFVRAVGVLAERLLGREAALPACEASPILRFFNRGGISL